MVVLVLVFGDGQLQGDESTYYDLAKILAAGRLPGIDQLWAGPGYAAFLTPFVWLGFGIHSLTTLNALLHAATLWLVLYTARRNQVAPKFAWITAALWASYIPALQTVRTMYTEPLAALLLMLSVYLLLKPRPPLLLTGLIFSALMLTKVVFAYVLGPACFLYLIWSKLRKTALPNYSRFASKIGLAYLAILPYSLFTYSLVHQPFYLSTAGGSSLYSMSTPSPNEPGSWIPLDWQLSAASFTQDSSTFNKANRAWQVNHAPIIQALAATSDDYERDKIYKHFAIQNILAHPFKYGQNIVANAARMLFNWPYAYYQPHWLSLVYATFNSVFIFGLLAIYRHRKHADTTFNFSGQLFVVCLLLTYLFASLLLSAYPRQLYVIYPALALLAISGHFSYIQSPKLAPRAVTN